MNSKIAIPKGRLFPYVDSLFMAKTGKTIDIGESRKLLIKDIFPNVDLFYAKAKSIPQLIYSGQVDFGFCGDDIISDSFYKNDIFEVGDTHLDKISLCVCSRLSKDELFSMKRPIIVATEYENLANQYFTDIGIPHYILNTYGSTEGYIDLGADCIIDIVETGETLRQNNINIIDILGHSTLKMFGHAALIDSDYPKVIDELFSFSRHRALTVEIDGNDGTGKSTIIKHLKSKYPEINFKDRGVLSALTLDENYSHVNSRTKVMRKLFNNPSAQTKHIILDCSEHLSQARIQSRGDSIDQEFHNLSDLLKYRSRFEKLSDDFDIPIISTEQPLDNTINEISKYIDKWK